MGKILAQYVAVGGAGFLGAIARLLVSSMCGRLFGTTFPVGTFIINISGSLLLGWFLAAAANRSMLSDTTRLAVAVGFIGSYTTFSTLMYETNSLVGEGSEIKAGLNLLGSLALGLAAVRVGMWLGGR